MVDQPWSCIALFNGNWLLVTSNFVSLCTVTSNILTISYYLLLSFPIPSTANRLFPPRLVQCTINILLVFVFLCLSHLLWTPFGCLFSFGIFFRAFTPLVYALPPLYYNSKGPKSAIVRLVSVTFSNDVRFRVFHA